MLNELDSDKICSTYMFKYKKKTYLIFMNMFLKMYVQCMLNLFVINFMLNRKYLWKTANQKKE